MEKKNEAAEEVTRVDEQIRCDAGRNVPRV